MKLTIVYDDRSPKNEAVRSDHGFSCYIETKKDVVLFDTGTSGDILLHNMKLLGKDPQRISKIVISHEHYDHNGGLLTVLDHCGDVTIYRLEDASSKGKTVQVEEPVQICDHIYSTGRLPGSPKDEQSLVFQTKKGVWVLVGCSHSGVKNIVETASRWGNVVGLIGGFHGFSDFSVLDSIDVVYPCHCTVHKEKIHDLFPEKSIRCKVGTMIRIEDV
ncbi:MAG: MBL fold metallo-hydrolase [Thermoplasmatota archaeon]